MSLLLSNASAEEVPSSNATGTSLSVMATLQLRDCHTMAAVSAMAVTAPRAGICLRMLVGSIWIVAAKPPRLVCIGDGESEITLGEPGVAAVVVIGGVFRVESDRLVVIREGAIIVAPGAPGIAAVVVIARVLRVEPDSLAVVVNGAIVVAPAAPDGAAVVEGTGVLRIEADRLVEVGYGAVVVALHAICGAAGVENIRLF